MSYGEGALWATSAGYVIRVDARSGRAKRWHIGYSLNGIAAADGRVAVSVYVPKRPEPTADLRAKVLNLGAHAAAMELASDIVGARAYRARAARHIAGISARGHTLAITLRHAAPDFPDRLTMAQFCPVPIATPIAATGDHDEPIPSAPAPTT